MFKRRARSSESEFIETTDAGARHDRGVVRNCVVGFDLVSPVVGEDRSAGAVLRNLFRHFVAFEHVLEGFDLETKLIGDIDQHQDLVRAVAVRMNVAFAFQNLDQRLELKIAPRRNQVLVAASRLPRDTRPRSSCNRARA